jgi:hypothetical protein
MQAMVSEDLVSLHQAAAMLDLPTVRVYRLGHYLRYAPTDPCLPRDLLAHAARVPDNDLRYRILLDGLLAYLHEDGALGRG